VPFQHDNLQFGGLGMKKHLAVISLFLLVLFPTVSLAANPYTIMMDERMQRAQHELDLAKKKKKAEQENLLKENLSLMKENLRLMSKNMGKMDSQMETMIRKYKSEHHRHMATLMQAMVQEHVYVLEILKQMVERRELRNQSLLKHSGN
jgi:hypothetical protein